MRPCLSVPEAETWLEYHADEEPCHSCTLAFALEMRMQGRCDGIPGEPPKNAGRTTWRTSVEKLSIYRRIWERVRAERVTWEQASASEGVHWRAAYSWWRRTQS